MTTDFKSSKSFLVHPYLHDKQQIITSPNSNTSFKNTMFEFRSGFTPKRHAKKTQLLQQDNYGSQTQTLATSKHLTQKLKEKSKISKEENIFFIPGLSQQNSEQKLNNNASGTSNCSSCENIEVQQDYTKLFQEDLLSNYKSLPQEVTFRSKLKGVNDKSQQSTFQVKSKSPHAISLKKKMSIQFASKSPKNMFSNEQFDNKLQKAVSSFDFNSKYNSEVQQLQEEIKKIKIEHQQIISNFDQIINNLTYKLSLKQEQLTNKSSMFMQEINQLIVDRNILERKLQNTINHCQLLGDNKYNVLIQLQQKLNSKDSRIRDLQSINHRLSTQVSMLKFQVGNLKSRAIKLDVFNIDSEISVFQQALKHSIQQVSKYKQRVQAKQQQINQLKHTYGLTQGQTQRTKNQLSIEQLKRVTQIQSLKASHQTSNIFKNNQINNLKQQIQLLHSKVQCLTKEVQAKNSLILNTIKKQ